MLQSAARSATETPWKPRAAKSSAAVARIWSRRLSGSVLVSLLTALRLALVNSGEREEELLHLLHVHVAGAPVLGEALLEPGGHDGEAGPVQRARDGRQLGDDVLALAALLEHAQDAGQLAL